MKLELQGLGLMCKLYILQIDFNVDFCEVDGCAVEWKPENLKFQNQNYTNITLNRVC